MSAHKYLFLKEQIRHNGTEIIIPEGFSLKEDPLIVQTVRAVLKCFPEELKKVFPVNVEEALRETEMGKYFEVFHELVVETQIKPYSSEEYFSSNRYNALHGSGKSFHLQWQTTILLCGNFQSFDRSLSDRDTAH